MFFVSSHVKYDASIDSQLGYLVQQIKRANKIDATPKEE
jgi:hypothetical protein